MLILIFSILLRRATDGINYKRMDVNFDDKTNDPSEF